MSHDHGSEYQIKVVHEDGAEEVSEWVTSEEQVVEMVASATGNTGEHAGFGNELFCVPTAQLRNIESRNISLRMSARYTMQRRDVTLSNGVIIQEAQKAIQ